MREKCFGSIRRSIKIKLPKFQLWNHKDLILPKESIKYLSRRDKSDRSTRIIIEVTLLKFQLWNCKISYAYKWKQKPLI